MTRVARTTRSLYLLALLALGGTACSDSSSPTEPEAAAPAPVTAAAATSVKTARLPYISYFKPHTLYIDMGPDGTYDNGVDIEITNPGPRADGLYLEASVTDNHYTVDGGTYGLPCSVPEGTLGARATCRLIFVVTPPPTYLTLGPGRLQIRLMQRGADGSVTSIDRRTVDVVLVHS